MAKKGLFAKLAEDITVFHSAEAETTDGGVKTEAEKETESKPEPTQESKPEQEAKPEKAEPASEPKPEQAQEPKPEKAEPASESKPEPEPKHESKKAEPEPEPNPDEYIPADFRKPLVNGYNHNQDQVVTVNGDVEVKVTNYGTATDLPLPQKANPLMEAADSVKFTLEEEASFRDLGTCFFETKRARDEGEVPGAALKFAELVFLKSPKATSKFIRKHIGAAIEADPELLTFIKEAEARKHQVERRFRPNRPDMGRVLLEEAAARAYVDEQIATLPERLKKEARDDDFGRWVFVEHNGDTGAVRELTSEEAKPHEEAWAKAHKKSGNPAAPSKKGGKAGG